MSTPQTEQRELTAGRELDALVAEKVMGWRRSLGCFDNRNNWNPEGVILVPFPGTEYGPKREWTTNPITNTRNVPHYSTDIAAAWEVVERLRENGWVIGIGIDDEPWEDPAGGGTHGCSLLGCNRGRTDATDIREYADTTPLAICLAALKAVPS